MFDTLWYVSKVSQFSLLQVYPASKNVPVLAMLLPAVTDSIGGISLAQKNTGSERRIKTVGATRRPVQHSQVRYSFGLS